MRTLLVVGLVMAAGRKKEANAPTPGSPIAPASTKDQDALWGR